AVKYTTTPAGRTLVAWRGDSSRVQDTPIIDFVAELMRREAKADLAATAAFSLESKLNPGDVTIAQLSQLYPYENLLRAVRINGAQLRAFLEHSSRYYRTLNADGSAPSGGIVDNGIPGYNFDVVAGADYVIDLRKPVGQRITSLSVKGKPVSDTDVFTFATNNYRQSGGGGYAMLASLPLVYEKEVDIRGLLFAELQRVGTIKPEDYFVKNWRLEPAAAVAMAYAQQNRGATPPASGTAPASNTAQPAGARTLRLITVSDFHAALEGRKDERGRIRGGAMALEAALIDARNECKDRCTSLTIDGGDLFAGSPASDWAAGKPTIAAYNRMGISAGALGNHELDFGQDTLRMRLAELNYRVLGINVAGPDGKIPGWLRGDTIVVRDGLRIGVIGAASQFTAGNTKKRSVTGLRFLDPAPLVSARIKELRAQNLDAVIVTIHDGARCTVGLSEGCEGSGIDFVRKLTEKPDAVLLAHAHTNMVLNINNIPSVQVSSNGRGIGIVDIPLNPRAQGKVSVRDVIGDSTRVVDPVLDTIVRNAVGRVRARLEQPVTTVKETLTRKGEQYPLGNLIADAMRVMGSADFGAWNNGGIRADLRAGPLNFGGVHEITPFGNVIAKLSVRGKDLKPMMENIVRGRAPDAHVSGLQVVYDPSKPVGQRVTSLTVADGRALDANKVYTIAVNDFMIDDPEFANPNLLVSTQILPITDSSAIAEYFKRQPQPLTAPTEVRIRTTGDSR
ncbi:MAG: 5'-nucleotidase C-terminal domain-containing protein, partial [Gemmatimonas sp.]